MKQLVTDSETRAKSAGLKYMTNEFARVLPAIRRNVFDELRTPGLSKRKVVAAVVRLLDKAGLRGGNRQYLQSNESRGSTTLSSENADINAYLNESGKTPVTAKDFRTRRGSVTALAAMKDIQPEMSETVRKDLPWCIHAPYDYRSPLEQPGPYEKQRARS